MGSILRARPLQAALASAVAFVSGAAVPIVAVLGGTAARAGGAPVLPGALRVAFWGAAAMAITAGIGKAFGTTV